MKRSLSQRERKIQSGKNNLIKLIKDLIKINGLKPLGVDDKVNVFVISANYWYGDYGRVGEVKNNTFLVGYELDEKVLASIFNQVDAYQLPGYDQIVIGTENNRLNDVFIVPKQEIFETRFILDNKSEFAFLKLANGQLYDVGNKFWFNVKDSDHLRKIIFSKHYGYIDPQNYFEDFDRD